MSALHALRAVPAASPRPLGRVRNLTKADVLLVSDADRLVVVKSVARRPWLCRVLFGRLLLAHEARILERLQGTPGVPRLLHRAPDGLVLEWLEGVPLRHRHARGIGGRTAGRLLALLEALHARGFAHGGLGADDVLLRPDGSVALVDFATAVGPGLPPLLWRVLHPLVACHDRRRARRLVARYLARNREFRLRRARCARQAAAEPGPAAIRATGG